MYDPPNGYHHGQDVPVAEHGAVYALRAGTVVVAARKPSPVLGYYYVIQVAPGDYDGYCHQLRIPAIGTNVTAGQLTSIAAGYNDAHGSAWSGPHLHYTNGPATFSVLGTDDVRDPRPVIRSVLAGFAGGGSIPLDDSDDAASALLNLRRKQEEMYVRAEGNPNQLYAVYTDPNGHERLRTCGPLEAKGAAFSAVMYSDADLTKLGQECGYAFGTANPLPIVKVSA